MSRRALALFALLSIMWGVPYLLIKVAVAEVSVPFLVFARSVLGALVLLPVALKQGGFAPVMSHWRPVLAFAIIEMIVPLGLIVHGELRLNSSTTGLLVAATPIIAVFLGRFRRDPEQLGVGRLCGLLLGLGGVATLAAPHLGGDLISVIEVLLAAACYAVGSMIAARWLPDVPSVPMTAACLALTSLAYAVPALANWPTAWPSAHASVAIAALGVACTAVAFAAFFLLIREVGSERAVVITYVAPAVAVASGVALLGEPLDGRLLAAFALILGGSWLATSRSTALRSATAAQHLNRSPRQPVIRKRHAITLDLRRVRFLGPSHDVDPGRPRDEMHVCSSGADHQVLTALGGASGSSSRTGRDARRHRAKRRIVCLTLGNAHIATPEVPRK